MYVGKAIYPVEYRLLNHFPDPLGGRPAIPEKWPEPPTFIVTICDRDKDAWYRGASLEGFLIEQLNPPVNKRAG